MGGRSDDKLLRISLALHTNPGVYALLVGSGLSRAAGIPTGWEIVVDLIGKVAVAAGDTVPTDPQDWYKSRFGEPAEYPKVVARLAPTRSERRALLRSYFEPTPEEREEGVKSPTDAHKAIARLASLGYVRVILTTNFDRLIEEALSDEGVAPQVVSSADGLRGAFPLVHTACTVLKLHGDYLDTRIRNTAKELAKYPRGINNFLDRVFDEYGLVVCGWSADWDTALADAIIRCPTRRFTTFWMTRGDLHEDARLVADSRRAEIVQIEGADPAFSQMLESVESLEELASPHPASTAVAIATVKRYLSSDQFKIRLHDLFRDEVEAVYQELSSDRFPLQGEFTIDDFRGRLHAYEALSEQLMSMGAALSYYNERASESLLTRALERLAAFEDGNSLIALEAFRRYPALQFSYAAGIAALASGRYANLAAVLLNGKFVDRQRDESKPLVHVVSVETVFSRETFRWVPTGNPKLEHTPPSNYLLECLRPFLKPYTPDENDYEDMFNIFEYLLALTFLDLKLDADEAPYWTPVGRFGWVGKRDWNRTPWVRFLQEGLQGGESWELLKAGFFGGSPDRATSVANKHLELLRSQTSSW